VEDVSLCRHDVGGGFEDYAAFFGTKRGNGQRGATRSTQEKGIIDGTVGAKQDDEESCRYAKGFDVFERANFCIKALRDKAREVNKVLMVVVSKSLVV